MEAEGLKYESGSPAAMALRDLDNSILVTNTTPKYEFSALNGEIFHGANVAGTAVTTQAGLSATTPALTLYNPVTSSVNLVLLKVRVSVHAAPAAASDLMLAYGSVTETAPSSTTDATMVSAKVGTTAAPVGRCYRIATLATAPTACRYLGSVIAASSTAFVQVVDDVDGAIVLTPGACVSIQATTAISILASFTWKEVAI